MPILAQTMAVQEDSTSAEPWVSPQAPFVSPYVELNPCPGEFASWAYPLDEFPERSVSGRTLAFLRCMIGPKIDLADYWQRHCW